MAEDNPEEPDDFEEEWKNAVQDGDLHRVQHILRDGRIDINAECFRYRWTALHYTSVFGHNLRIMRFLLEHGADVNHQTKCGSAVPPLW